MSNFEQAIEALKSGNVIAYPTEGVFGVGCDPDNPDAIKKLLLLKKRSVDKGLILIAASYQQILPYIDESVLDKQRLETIQASWPGAVTWVMPVSAMTSEWVRGRFQSVAVRVTDHPLVQKLCLAYGKPITSTSANLSGRPPCMSVSEVQTQLGSKNIVILEGQTGGRSKPSEIRDALSLNVLRQG